MSMEDMVTISKKEQRRAEVLALLAEGAILQKEAAERLDEDHRIYRRARSDL